MCSDGNFQATKLDPLVLLLDTRVLGLPWKSRQMARWLLLWLNFTEKRVTRVLGFLRKSRQMPRCLLTRNFTEKPVSRASGYKGLWIFAKIPSNAPMFPTLTRNFMEKSLSRASGCKGPWIFAKISSNAPMFAVMTRNFAKNSVNRASGYEGRKSRQMAPMFQLWLATNY